MTKIKSVDRTPEEQHEHEEFMALFGSDITDAWNEYVEAEANGTAAPVMSLEQFQAFVLDQTPEQRLQQLREEFEAEQNAFCARVNQRNPFFDTDQLLRGTDVDWFAVSFGTLHGSRWLKNHEAFKLIDAARHYIIARDWGEFDRKRALMLWKLQNGGAL